MPTRPLRRGAAALAVAGALAGSVALAAAAPSGAASVATPAERAPVEFGDVAVVYQLGGIDATVVTATERVAAQLGAQSTVGRTGTLHARSIARPATVAYSPPDEYTFPLVFAAFTPESLGWVLGFDIAAAVAPDVHPDGVVLNADTAALTGAQVGDTVTLEARSGGLATLTVTAIVPRDVLGGTEIVMTTALADRLGETRATRTIVWGFDDRAAADAAFAANGLTGRPDTEVARSWDAPDPDSVFSTLEIKQRVGTPWYKVGEGGTSVTMHPAWRASNLPAGRELLNDAIAIRARCNLTIVADLRAALAAVAAAGLGPAIEVDNANTYGGCYAPRFARDSWNLSRHSLAIALDTNTVSNCAGCQPTMNCDVVRIFRRHNFAWGGNFNRADGMHFEWVGERRDQLPYPSAYCPNLIDTAASGTAPAATIGREVFDAGLPD